MPGTRRKFPIAHGIQGPPHCRFNQGDAKFIVDPGSQITQPPTHNPMQIGRRPVFDHPRQGPAASRVQARRRTRRRAVQQTVRTAGVETQNPVPHRLHTNTAMARCLATRAAIINQRKRQKPPRLLGAIRRPRQSAKVVTV